MPAKRRRRVKKRQKQKAQRGGTAPIFVDFKKGVNVTKDLIKALKKPTVPVQKAKAVVKGYKQQYQDYKRRGGSKSYNSWLVDKGYASRDSGCCIM